uniref:Uncharacterized protein n=1 Tax=Ursus americanus TaxID=9643 RepID=A0A452QXG5_URSAM
ATCKGRVSQEFLRVCYKMGLLIVFTGLCLLALVKADSKAITTSLTTKWFSTPLLLEVSCGVE